MNISLLDILACPRCKGRLWVKAVWLIDYVNEGDLYCEKCGAVYPITKGIPRFVKSDGYVSSFSLEWARHAKTQLDSVSGLTVARDSFFQRTGFTSEDLKGKLALDAGCGIGRYMEVAQGAGARIIGVDMSYSVDQAYENVGKLPNVDIVQADLLNLPFKEGVFDTVFSLGVLHHTSNCHEAFKSVAKLPKTGGSLAVWLYANDGLKQKAYNAVAAFWRIYTKTMRPDRLYDLCEVANWLYPIHKSKIGWLTRSLFPTSMESLPEWRQLDTFDWYSPKYQSKHTYAQVDRWFREAGYGQIINKSFPTSVNGTKMG